MLRALPLAALLLVPAAPALAGQDCQDQFNQCQDDCSLQHGSSVKDEAKKAFQKCLSKCVKKSNLCTEQAMEVKSNDLDDKALDKDSAAAQELDENGYAKKGAGLRGKAVKGKDDVREEDPPGFFDDPGDGDAHRKKKKKKKAKPEVREEEVVKSTRTSFGEEPDAKPAAKARSDDEEPAPKEKASAKAKEEPPPASKADKGGKKGKAPVVEVEPKPEPKPEPKAEVKDEPPPRPKESKPVAKPARDDDEDEKPKKGSKAKEPPPKKDDDDDLRNY